MSVYATLSLFPIYSLIILTLPRLRSLTSLALPTLTLAVACDRLRCVLRLLLVTMGPHDDGTTCRGVTHLQSLLVGASNSGLPAHEYRSLLFFNSIVQFLSKRKKKRKKKVK